MHRHHHDHHRHHLALIFLVQLLIIEQASSQCPLLQFPCRCAPSVYEPISIVCENAENLATILSAIADAQSVTIDSLLIYDTVIPVLPANAFQDFTILRLVLNRCTLSLIEEDAFAGPTFARLADLDLSDNQLGSIPTTGVWHLPNLRKLYLNRNRINQLDASTFSNYESRDRLSKLELAGNRLTDQALGNSMVFRPLRALQQLSLETNALSDIPSMALTSQRQTLVNLNLGLNQISQVPVGALDFPNLSSLSLEFNGITHIIPQSLQNVPNLRYLYLTGNKFPSWQPEMFMHIPQLLTLGIGETPISVIPSNAFQYIPKLIRLEMSEAAVDTIERGAFQRTPDIQAIILNKNRLSVIRSDCFRGLNNLYSINLAGNRIEIVESSAFANLPQMNHLDISFNQLQTLPDGTFTNSFLPEPSERRVMYVCGNPWLCNSALQWFRQYLRDNVDIDIDKPGCVAACMAGVNGCPPAGTPLRAIDQCTSNDAPLPLTGGALSLIGWIILAIIMTILLISICLMALVRYGISHRRKKQKEHGDDERRIISSGSTMQGIGAPSVITRSYISPPPIDLDLPQAHTLDDAPSQGGYFY